MNLINKITVFIKKPAIKISFFFIVLFSFIGGIIFWVSFNHSLEMTNTEEFCLSCHANNVGKEYKNTIHDQNHAGVRATCPDCHVPHEWNQKITRKVQASKEVLSYLQGNISTQEKFDKRRLAMAEREWKRFKETKSQACKNCHDYNGMDFSKMSGEARAAMTVAAKNNQSCVDCHKGIAHNLPDTNSGYGEMISNLLQISSDTQYVQNHNYFTIISTPLYLESDLKNKVALINPVTKVKVLNIKKEAIEVEISGWKKLKGFGRVIFEDYGKNIVEATINRKFLNKISQPDPTTKRTDSLTGLDWEKTTITGWVKKENLVDDINIIWGPARETYASSCSACHTLREESHYTANAWPGMFKGMVGFTNLDPATQDIIIKYLQKHSLDYSKH